MTTTMNRPPAAPQADRRPGIWTRQAPHDALLDAPATHDTRQAQQPRDDARDPRAGVWALPTKPGRLLAA